MTPSSRLFQTRISQEAEHAEGEWRCIHGKQIPILQTKLLVKSMTGKVDAAVIGAGGAELNAIKTIKAIRKVMRSSYLLNLSGYIHE